MKTISFKCEDSSAHLFVQILNRLIIAGARHQTRKIRIGGDEYSFVGGCDLVSEMSIDGKLYSDLTPSEQRDLQILRCAVVTPAPAPAPATVSNIVSPSASSSNPPTVPDTDDGNDDDDLLTSAEAIVVRDVIVSKVGQGQMFTAFDITKELRHRGDQVHHRNIKQIVHAFYNHGEMQGYDRSIITVNGTSARPFLYHPVNADLSTYSV